MTDLFTRSGTLHTGSIHTDKTGPFFTKTKICSRCGGAGGGKQWAHTGYTCFDCGGAGTRGTEIVRLFTAEKLAKLNDTQAKRRAIRQAKLQAQADVAKAAANARSAAFFAAHGDLLASAEPFLERSPFLKDVVRRARETAQLSDAQLAAIQTTVAKITAQDAAAAASRHVGMIGQRIEIQVTVERVASFDRVGFSGRPETVWIVTMRDSDGNALVSKSPRFRAEKGMQLTIKGTVKEHSEFRDEKQTVLQRIVC